MDYLYPQSHIDENLVQDILISSLEKFLCVDEDPEKIFKVKKFQNFGSNWVPNKFNWVQMGPNGSKWIQIGPNVSKWVLMCPKWVQMGPNGSK